MSQSFIIIINKKLKKIFCTAKISSLFKFLIAEILKSQILNDFKVDFDLKSTTFRNPSYPIVNILFSFFKKLQPEI